MRTDARGNPVTGADGATLEAYEKALRAFQSYTATPSPRSTQRSPMHPTFVNGHLLKTFALYTLGERQFVPMAQASLAAAQARAGGAHDRERRLIAAAERLLAGQWDAACIAFDHVLAAYPRDALALQAGHLMDFFRGDALNLRNRVSRVLPHWNAGVPGYSFVLGMHAFGLEEMNQYREAEETARRALAIEPRDGWSVHAATHVMEMQGRIDEGIAWLTSRERDWAPDNGFAFHNFWHLALFRLDGGDVAGALDLFDRHVHPSRPRSRFR